MTAKARLAKYEAEVVVADMQAAPLQGTPAKGVAVLRFPSEQAIRDRLADPGYQPVKQVRLPPRPTPMP